MQMNYVELRATDGKKEMGVPQGSPWPAVSGLRGRAASASPVLFPWAFLIIRMAVGFRGARNSITFFWEEKKCVFPSVFTFYQ